MPSPTFLAFDTETTGLIPGTDEILSIALLILDENIDTLSTKTLYAFPSEESRVSQRAAEVNGYTREGWEKKGAISQEELFTALRDFFSGHSRLIPLGHNVKFDLGFLHALFDLNDSNKLRRALSYHSLDTVGIAMFADLAVFRKLGSSYKLVDLCSRYSIDLTNAHDALADIQATVALFKHLYTQVGGENGPALAPPEVRSGLLKKTASDEWVLAGGKHSGTPLSALAVSEGGYVTWMLRTLTDLAEDQRDALREALSNAG